MLFKKLFKFHKLKQTKLKTMFGWSENREEGKQRRENMRDFR